MLKADFAMPGYQFLTCSLESAMIGVPMPSISGT